MNQKKEETGFRPVECKCCGESIRDPEQTYTGDEGTFYAGEPLCETCYYEDEPCATVHYSDGGPESCEPEYPYRISHTRNETEGDFEVEWHRTDPWRGYYEAKSDRYVQLADDCILSGSDDADELKKFDEKVRELLDKVGVRHARVFCRSSNVFSTGYDLYALKEDLGDPAKSAELYGNLILLKLKHRDPERFRITALTGKTSVKEHTPNDRLAVEAFERLRNGENPETVQNDILRKASLGVN